MKIKRLISKKNALDMTRYQNDNPTTNNTFKIKQALDLRILLFDCGFYSDSLTRAINKSWNEFRNNGYTEFTLSTFVVRSR